MLDVYRAARPNGAGVIAIVSGGWQSSVELARIFAQAYPPLNEKGFTVFAVRHGSWPRYPLSSIVADMRRSVRFIRQHAKEYGVDPNRIGVFGSSAGGHLALLLGTTGDSGDPSASDPVLRESSRVAAVVANFPPTDLARWATQQPVFNVYRGRSGAVLTHSLRLAWLGSLAHRARRRRHGRPDRSGGDDVRGVDEGGRARVIHSNQRRGTRVRGRRSRRSRARLCRNDSVVRAASWERGEVESSQAQCRSC